MRGVFHIHPTGPAAAEQVCQDRTALRAPVPALDLFAALPTPKPTTKPTTRSTATHTPAGQSATAAERVIAAELQGRGQSSDALSMMVSSMVRMVQVGKQRDSRWKAS